MDHHTDGPSPNTPGHRGGELRCWHGGLWGLPGRHILSQGSQSSGASAPGFLQFPDPQPGSSGAAMEPSSGPRRGPLPWVQASTFVICWDGQHLRSHWGIHSSCPLPTSWAGLKPGPENTSQLVTPFSIKEAGLRTAMEQFGKQMIPLPHRGNPGSVLTRR